MKLSVTSDGKEFLWSENLRKCVIDSPHQRKTVLEKEFPEEADLSGNSHGLAFDPYAKLFWACRGTRIYRHSAVSGAITCVFKLPRVDNDTNGYIALAIGKSYGFASTRDGVVDCIHPVSMKLQFSYPISNTSIDTVALSRNESLAIAGTFDGRIACIPLPYDENLPLEKRASLFKAHEGRVNSVSVRGDGRLLASGGNDGKLHLWIPQGDKWERLADLPTGGKAVKQLHFDAAGTKLCVLLAGERGIRVWQLGKLQAEFEKHQVGW